MFACCISNYIMCDDDANVNLVKFIKSWNLQKCPSAFKIIYD